MNLHRNFSSIAALLFLCVSPAASLAVTFDALLPPTVELASRWQAVRTPGGAPEPVSPAEQEAAISRWPSGDGYRMVRDVTVDITLPPGRLPAEKEVAEAAQLETPAVDDLRRYGQRPLRVVHWAPTCYCHRPLYFEESNLERHSYTHCRILQPAISGAHFFAAIPALPYKMAAECPRDCVYTLGHYRPGSCVPWRVVWPPCDLKAGVVEAGVAVGLVFLIP